MKDRTENGKTTFKIIGASNHSDRERGTHDYYATDPLAAELLLQNEQLRNVWECACGEMHLADVFRRHGVLGRASDLIDRCGNETFDFLSIDNIEWDGDIVTNPPYRYAREFVEKSLSLVEDGSKVCMFLRLQFLEGVARKSLFRKYPPRVVYVFSKRVSCAMNGDFVAYRQTAMAFAWFVWTKGYNGDTTIKWIN